MIKYILKRLALAVLILFGVSFIIYALVRLKPGLDFIEAKYQTQLQFDETGEVRKMVDEQRAIYGLTSPIFEGYLKWLSNVLQGDWGDSFIFSVNTGKVEYLYDENGLPILDDQGNHITKAVSSKNVIDVIVTKSGISFIIAFIATVLQFAIAIPLGIISATKQYGVVDYTVTVLAMMGISLPSFFSERFC